MEQPPPQYTSSQTPAKNFRKTLLVCTLLLIITEPEVLVILDGVFHQSSNSRWFQCQAELYQLNDIDGKDQTDEVLIETVKQKLLIGPSKKAYNFEQGSNPNTKGQIGAPLAVDEILNYKRNGFFIEAGAHDGESISNSLFFELNRNWTGLLVEPNPMTFAQLRGKNRKAYSIQTCFSTSKTAETFEFKIAGVVGGILPKELSKEQSLPTHRVNMTCIPFYTIMMALGNPTVDYFSLDIEGAELPVLKTIPFDKLDIRVIDLEVAHIGQVFEGSKKNLEELMEANGYVLHQHKGIDDIYVKRDLFKA